MDEREQKLLRWNEELEARRQKAIALADAVAQEQHDRLATSPLKNYSPQRHQDRHVRASPAKTERESFHFSYAEPPESPPHAYSPPHSAGGRSSTSNNNTASSNNRNIPSSSRPTSAKARLGDNFSMTSTAATPASTATARREQDVRDEIDLVDAGVVGADNSARILRAKLKVVQDELDATISDLRAREAECIRLENIVSDQAEQIAKLQRGQLQQQASLDKAKKSSEQKKAQIANLERDIAALTKETERANKLQKQLDQEGGSRDARLNRALEEIDRLKQSLKDATQENKELTESSRRQHDRFLQENKKLQRQKTELIAAFRKQMKLIDILKRQKMHIEAAKLMQFSEEEFTRALDLGEQL